MWLSAGSALYCLLRLIYSYQCHHSASQQGCPWAFKNELPCHRVCLCHLVNLTGKTIDTNGQLIPHVGPNAVDGTFNTYYHSAVTNNYKFWRVDLIQEYEVEKIVLHQRQGGFQ